MDCVRHAGPERKIMTSKKDFNKWKGAIWQYMLDHATPQNNMILIRFRVRDQKDFFNRVRARYTGEFKRTDEKKFQEEAEREIKRIGHVQSRHAKNQVYRQKLSLKIERLRKHGTPTEKARMWVYAILKRLMFVINPIKPDEN